MKCPNCGTENYTAAGRCYKCGAALRQVGAAKGIAGRPPSGIRLSREIEQSRASPTIAHVGPEEVARKLKFEYAHGQKNPAEKILETIQLVTAHLENRPVDVQKLMNEMVSVITKHFGIANATVGLRDPDGLYRYKAFGGLKPETEDAQRKIAYELGQFMDSGGFKGTIISKYSKVYLDEERPDAQFERDAYNRPALLGSRRRAPDESLEGDYIDTHVFGAEGELLGWIEISGTRLGKMPDVATIRAVEVMASILGVVLSSSDLRRPSKKL